MVVITWRVLLPGPVSPAARRASAPARMSAWPYRGGPVHEAPVAGLLPGDLPTEHEQVLGPGHAREARHEPRRAAVGRERERRERRPQAGVGGDDREVRCQ